MTTNLSIADKDPPKHPDSLRVSHWGGSRKSAIL